MVGHGNIPQTSSVIHDDRHLKLPCAPMLCIFNQFSFDWHQTNLKKGEKYILRLQNKVFELLYFVNTAFFKTRL